MAFKRKTDTGSGEQFKFERVNQKLTGYYLGSFDHDGEYGPTKKHVFKTPKGIQVVFGQTHLTQLLDGERPGPLMQVTYTGDKKTGKGKPMKQYTLDIDADQMLDSDEIPASSDEVESGTEEVYGGAEDDTPPEDENEEEESQPEEEPAAPAPTKTRSTADTKARLAEVMKRIKK